MTIKIILLCLLIVWAIVFVSAFIASLRKFTQKEAEGRKFPIAVIVALLASTVAPIMWVVFRLNRYYLKFSKLLKRGMNNLAEPTLKVGKCKLTQSEMEKSVETMISFFAGNGTAYPVPEPLASDFYNFVSIQTKVSRANAEQCIALSIKACQEGRDFPVVGKENRKWIMRAALSEKAGDM